MSIVFTVQLLPVFVAALVSFMVGWLWYSPSLFGKVWMEDSKLTKESMTKSKKKGMTGTIIIGFIAQLVMAWVLSVFISASGGANWVEGLNVAFWAWLGFVASKGFGKALWEGKSMKLFWINMLHWLVALLIMGAILGAWM